MVNYQVQNIRNFRKKGSYLVQIFGCWKSDAAYKNLKEKGVRHVLLHRRQSRYLVMKMFVNKLFCDVWEVCDLSSGDSDEDPPILEAEIRWAINTAKTGKAPDEVSMEMFKLMNDNSEIFFAIFTLHLPIMNFHYIDGKKIISDNSVVKLTVLCYQIYDRGTIPLEWLSSIFITLPKKSNPRWCYQLYEPCSRNYYPGGSGVPVEQGKPYLLCRS